MMGANTGVSLNPSAAPKENWRSAVALASMTDQLIPLEIELSTKVGDGMKG
jgi:hypothetical protein